ncbi:MAG: non-homologous end-joining DNA ligase [Thermoplasmata archaeon]|nr:non-homologous end-joining DNA ligase [Thermoplasmata archaeon]
MKYAPMLCQKGDESILDSNAYIFEPKLDGTRCIAEVGKEVKLYNRREKNISRRYPFICKELSKVGNVILDGEIVCYNKEGKPDFYLLQKREHVESDLIIEMRAKLISATYVIFDILEMDEKPLIKKPIEERKEILNEIFSKSRHLEIIFFTENGKILWEEIRKRNLEGVIAKEKGSRYFPGERRKEWLKIKNVKSIDVIIIGYTTEKREISALGMGLYRGEKIYYVGKVGTGFEEEIMQHLLKNFERTKPYAANAEKAPPHMIWVKPRFVAEVEYLEVTKDMELRSPSFKRLRNDKEPEECTFEQL